MENKRDYYEILGINRNADSNAIKKAYRKLAKKYHPDTNVGNPDAEKKFKEITEAYSVLIDPEKKKLYDQFGHAAFDQNAEAYRNESRNRENKSGGSSFYHFTEGPNNYHEFHYQGNADDIFDDVFRNMFHGSGFSEDLYGDPFGRQKSSGKPHFMKGEDLHAEVTIPFDDAVFGCEKRITLQKGDGTASSLQIHIPAGIDTGKSIRLREKGMPGQGGAKAGDLLIKVTVEAKPGIERKGKDIYTTVRVPYTTAVFGGEVKVPTLYGDVICSLKEGTQPGSKIRLKGKGMVSMNEPNVYGDHYVTIEISVPKHLNPKARQKLMEYRQAC